jgi:hypothetical protein
MALAALLSERFDGNVTVELLVGKARAKPVRQALSASAGPGSRMAARSWRAKFRGAVALAPVAPSP